MRLQGSTLTDLCKPPFWSASNGITTLNVFVPIVFMTPKRAARPASAHVQGSSLTVYKRNAMCNSLLWSVSLGIGTNCERASTYSRDVQLFRNIVPANAELTLFWAGSERFDSDRWGGADSASVGSKKPSIGTTSGKRRWIGLSKIYNFYITNFRVRSILRSPEVIENKMSRKL